MKKSGQNIYDFLSENSSWSCCPLPLLPKGLSSRRQAKSQAPLHKLFIPVAEKRKCKVSCSVVRGSDISDSPMTAGPWSSRSRLRDGKPVRSSSVQAAQSQ